MLTSGQVREKMLQCLSEVQLFTTADLKEMLKKQGCVYNKDYEVNAFSNAVSFLAKHKHIVATGKKGEYYVADNEYETQNMNENIDVEQDDEIELKEMRNKIKNCLNTYYIEIEGILDSEKPSVFGRNKRTYEDILRLIEYIKNFTFAIDEENEKNR